VSLAVVSWRTPKEGETVEGDNLNEWDLELEPMRSENLRSCIAPSTNGLLRQVSRCSVVIEANGMIISNECGDPSPFSRSLMLMPSDLLPWNAREPLATDRSPCKGHAKWSASRQEGAAKQHAQHVHPWTLQ
jgi:hypothetical protein